MYRECVCAFGMLHVSKVNWNILNIFIVCSFVCTQYHASRALAHTQHAGDEIQRPSRSTAIVTARFYWNNNNFISLGFFYVFRIFFCWCCCCCCSSSCLFWWDFPLYFGIRWFSTFCVIFNFVCLKSENDEGTPVVHSVQWHNLLPSLKVVRSSFWWQKSPI